MDVFGYTREFLSLQVGLETYSWRTKLLHLTTLHHGTSQASWLV